MVTLTAYVPTNTDFKKVTTTYLQDSVRIAQQFRPPAHECVLSFDVC